MERKYILFVCGHNSGRSQMAEVYFNVYNKNPNVEALSAGTGIEENGALNPRVVTLLEKKGIDIFTQPKQYFPKSVSDDMVQGADKLYTMGCMDGKCNFLGRKVDFDFGLDDPAQVDTNIDKMWEDFETKMQPILKYFNY